MKNFVGMSLGLAVAIAMTGVAGASPLVYRPINPSFGGDPLNGNWLLSSGQSQAPGGTGGDFTIDFPDFGGVPQPTTPTDPATLPQTPVTGTNS